MATLIYTSFLIVISAFMGAIVTEFMRTLKEYSGFGLYIRIFIGILLFLDATILMLLVAGWYL